MVAAVAYTFISEVLVAFIPAVINQLTVQFHLRNLLAKWLGGATIARILQNRQFFSTAPPWQHVTLLLLGAGVVLLVAVLLLRRRELTLLDQP